MLWTCHDRHPRQARLMGCLLCGLGPVSAPTSLGRAPGGLGHKEAAGLLQEGLCETRWEAAWRGQCHGGPRT